MQDPQEFADYVEKMKTNEPMARFSCCFSHTETEQCGEGQPQRRNVVTFSDHKEFQFETCEDITDDEWKEMISKHPMSRITSTFKVQYANEESEQLYHAEFEKWKAEKMPFRDAHNTFYQRLTLPGIEDQILVERDLNSRPWWLNSTVYGLSCLTCMCCVFEKMLDRVAPEEEITFVKKVTMLGANAAARVHSESIISKETDNAVYLTDTDLYAS